MNEGIRSIVYKSLGIVSPGILAAAPAKPNEKPKGKGKPGDEPPPSDIELGSPKYYLYCAIGGAICCGLTHTAVVPLDLVKTRVQVNPKKYKGLRQGLKLTVAEEGYVGLTRGWVPTLIGYSMQGACKFGFYEYFKHLYADMVSEEDAYRYRTLLYLAASSSAEFLADIALSPMEAIRVKIQTAKPGCSGAFLEVADRMYKKEGVYAFYKSLVPLWCRQVPYTMMKFASFERTVEFLYKNVVPKPREECTKMEQLVVTFTAGYIAGVLCAVVSHPADTLVSKMNTEKSSAKDIIKKLGPMGIWRGLGTRIIMIGTLTGLQWFIYDWFKVVTGMPRPPPPSEPQQNKAGGGKGGKKPPEPPKKIPDPPKKC